jgi:penicillin-binding protein 2
MFIFDIFKREARRLRIVSVAVAAGMFVLLAGLWYVQIVSAQQLESRLLQQSFREVQVPGVRGRILDRNGKVLAENRPQYNAVLYLEDLRGQFGSEYSNHVRKEYLREHPGLPASKLPWSKLYQEAEYNVVSNISHRVGMELGQTNEIDPGKFRGFYRDYRHVPFQILTNLNAKQVAIFSEKMSDHPWLDLEAQPVRSYPLHDTAAHLLGYVQRTGENPKYLPADYEGRSGIEGAFDEQLAGQPGTNSVLVDYLGYRQPKHDVISEAQPGKDLCLTIDTNIQKAAESALSNLRGAAVVMDVRNGDILAMVSAPAFDPNEFVGGVSQARWKELNDPKLKPMDNKAISYDTYPPGSTFKIITAIACLESGVMDPEETYRVAPNKDDPIHGVFTEDHYHIDDTAPPGDYNFEKAFFYSSNTYFCHYGMKAGLRKLLEVAKRFHLGEKTGFPTHDELAGDVPGPEQAGKSKPMNSAPYVAIGQEIQVTPLQMTVMIAAIANGGTIFWPRIVSHTISSDGTVEELFKPGRVRDQVQINPQHLQLIRHAMLEDTENVEAKAHPFFFSGSTPRLPNFRVAGKTGTAEVKSQAYDYKKVTWFDSYGPYENPRYAVVVMVVGGGSGAIACAPVAMRIYQAIIRQEQAGRPKAAVALN